MIKATSQSVCSGITGCQVELLGSGAELIKEYKGVTAAMYRSLRGHMPEELAKEVLVSITKEAIKQAEAKKMKTLKITTDNKISIIDLDFDHKSLREEVGGYVELVRTQKLLDYFKTKVVMIVDEEGLVKNLPMNPMGCYFYDTDKHGNPIVGDVILGLLVGFDMHVTGLGDRDAEQWMEKMLKDFPVLQKENIVNE